MHHWLLLLLLLSSPSTKVQDGLVVMSEVEFASVDENKELSEPLLMDVAFPSTTTTLLPAVIFVHGGGWSRGKREDGMPIIKLLASGGYFACSIDYRLTQDAGFPAAVHDCKAAIKFLRKNAEELGIDGQRIGLVGYSAGGHLAALVGLSDGVSDLDGTINGEEVSTTVRCIGSVSGTVMPQLARGRGKKVYEDWALQNEDVSLKETLPQTYLDRNDPPIYLLCGSDDHISPVSHTEKFIDLLEESNINAQIEVLPKRGHSITQPELYYGLLAFLDKQLGGHAEQSVKKYVESKDSSGRSRK